MAGVVESRPRDRPRPLQFSGTQGMFGFTWLTHRQAGEAIKQGLLDEALRLLRQPNLRAHRRTGELMLLLARAYADRGERRLRQNDAEQAWCDLLLAESLQTGEKTADRLRRALTELGVTEVRSLLQTGDVNRADELLARFRDRGATSTELGTLEQGLRLWAQARDLAGSGNIGPALEAANKATIFLGANKALELFLADLRQIQDTFPNLLARLHDEARREHWREVVELSERVLALSPQHAEARSLRTRAWQALGPAPATDEAQDATTTTESERLPSRFHLWIDGVGGYLVCLRNRLTFGQALPGARVDVPLVADVSRLHASISRDEEGYVLEAVRPIQVNGATVIKALLQAGDRVTLGASCQVQFRLPAPGNMTARLDLMSGHRLPTSVEGVILLAETLVIGSGPQSHVLAPEVSKPIVLFRHRDGLGLKHQGELRVNGRVSSGRTILPPDAAVAGEEISFAIEPLEG